MINKRFNERLSFQHFILIMKPMDFKCILYSVRIWRGVTATAGAWRAIKRRLTFPQRKLPFRCLIDKPPSQPKLRVCVWVCVCACVCDIFSTQCLCPVLSLPNSTLHSSMLPPRGLCCTLHSTNGKELLIDPPKKGRFSRPHFKYDGWVCGGARTHTIFSEMEHISSRNSLGESRFELGILWLQSTFLTHQAILPRHSWRLGNLE